MKTLRKIFLLILFIPVFSMSQNKGNPHFFKLLAFNENHEILLIKFDGSWEIPGSRFSGDSTMPIFIDGMAKKHGIKVENTKLSAVVTFHHETRKVPTMMFYFQSHYTSGELSTPSWGEDLKWFPAEKAYELIPYEEMNYIIKSIISKDDFLTGAFTIKYDSAGKRTGKFQIIDDLK